jgi:hypothetical protein
MLLPCDCSCQWLVCEPRSGMRFFARHENLHSPRSRVKELLGRLRQSLPRCVGRRNRSSDGWSATRGEIALFPDRPQRYSPPGRPGDRPTFACDPGHLTRLDLEGVDVDECLFGWVGIVDVVPVRVPSVLERRFDLCRGRTGVVRLVQGRRTGNMRRRL